MVIPRSASVIDVGSQDGPNGHGKTNDYVRREGTPGIKQPCKEAHNCIMRAVSDVLPYDRPSASSSMGIASSAKSAWTSPPFSNELTTCAART